MLGVVGTILLGQMKVRGTSINVTKQVNVNYKKTTMPKQKIQHFTCLGLLTSVLIDDVVEMTFFLDL